MGPTLNPYEVLAILSFPLDRQGTEAQLLAKTSNSAAQFPSLCPVQEEGGTGVQDVPAPRREDARLAPSQGRVLLALQSSCSLL